MKRVRINYLFYFTALAFLSVSCASTSKSAVAQDTDKEAVQVQEKTPLEIYTEKTSGIKLTVLSFPKETTKTKAFTGSFSVKAVSADESSTPLTEFPLTFIYPSSREAGKIKYECKEIFTNTDGTAEFTPDVPQFAFNDSVTVFPSVSLSGKEDDEEVLTQAKKNALKMPFMVQTNLKTSGGIIAVVDFNQNDKPVYSTSLASSTLLMTLMQLGFKGIGNIDLTNDVLKDDDAKIYKDAKSMVGSTSSFLIYGTVKYGETGKTEQGALCTLIGNIKCMNLKDGTVSCIINQTVSVTDKNEWNALTSARKKLSEEIAKQVKYGL